MKESIKIFMIIAGFFLIQTGLQAQTRKELEDQRLKIIKDIEKTSKALNETQKSKVKNQGQIKILEEQMNSRKKLISNLESQLKVNEQNIAANFSQIEQLQTKHQALKSQYASILRSSYLKKLTNSKWSYLLSSENLNNLILRWRYIHQFDHFTTNKLQEIVEIQDNIHKKNAEIEQDKIKTMSVIDETSKNVATLQKEQKEKDELQKKLSKEEQNLTSTLKKREREREHLNASIEKIILAELAKVKENEKGNTAAVKKKEIDNSGFSKNKGALEWPVSKGKITGRFGTHDHPTIKNVKVSNNGVDFTLPSASNVECVYDGEVVGVTSIPGFKTMIIIKHGSYYSVYSKLDDAHVSKGQKIKRGQNIGHVSTGDDGKAELHFELWKDKVKLNPEQWFR